MRELPFFLPTLATPTAGQCLAVVSPFLGLLALRWLIRNTDQIIERLFPHLGWEKRLGWLNLRAYQRAEAALRWLGYGVYAALAASLYGIVWATPALANLAIGNDPAFFEDADLKVPILFLCLGFWLIYLTCDLIPRLRRDYEWEELKIFRAEQAKLDGQSGKPTSSRLRSPQISVWDSPLHPPKTKSRR